MQDTLGRKHARVSSSQHRRVLLKEPILLERRRRRQECETALGYSNETYLRKAEALVKRRAEERETANMIFSGVVADEESENKRSSL